MNNPFVPDKPQEEITVTITKREAVLLDKLRKYQFGRFLIHKQNGILIRIEITDSQLLDSDTPTDL